MIMGYCSALFLSLTPTLIHSLSAPSAVQQRKSILRPWKTSSSSEGQKQRIGWCLETVDATTGYQVSVGWDNDADGTVKDGTDDDEQSVSTSTVQLTPDAGDRDGSLSSSLWPVSIASAILMRSPNLIKTIDGKRIHELGCGLGLTSLVLASTLSPPSSFMLSDMDESATERLNSETLPLNPQIEASTIQCKTIDWRDTADTGDDASANDGKGNLMDVIVGSDIAYYYHLIRPLMETMRSQLFGTTKLEEQDDDKLIIVIGQANRESQWELYKNIKEGGYNTVTDEKDGPWPGDTTCMLLYELEISEWKDAGDPSFTNDGTIPVAALVHSTKEFGGFSQYDYVATKEDGAAIQKSF